LAIDIIAKSSFVSKLGVNKTKKNTKNIIKQATTNKKGLFFKK
jgi:hypothetical protein